MWTSVYMSQNPATAKEMRQKIEEFNILVMQRLIKLDDGTGEDCFELLVPSAEVNEALDIIITE